MYLPDEFDPAVVYVFASKGGAPTNPAWYYNLIDAGETYAVKTEGIRTIPVLRFTRL